MKNINKLKNNNKKIIIINIEREREVVCTLTFLRFHVEDSRYNGHNSKHHNTIKFLIEIFPQNQLQSDPNGVVVVVVC